MAVRKNRSTAERTKGAKVKFLVVLPTDAIKDMKLRAIERGVTASSLLEAAVDAWMRRNRHAARKPLDKLQGERRQFLSQMDADLVRDLKVMAIDWRATASALVGQAVVEAFRRKT